MARPFTFINSAMSADGKISSFEHKQVRISGTDDLSRVDRLRASSDAVMVGIGTVLADDPKLRVKSGNLRKERLGIGKTENPLRVVVDSMARTPLIAKVLGEGCLVAVSGQAPNDRIEMLSKICEVVPCSDGDEKVDLVLLMSMLCERGIERLMVEGGATLNWSMIKAGLVDEIYTYIGAMIIGGRSAPTLVDGEGCSENFPGLELLSLERLDDGALLKWRVL